MNNQKLEETVAPERAVRNYQVGEEILFKVDKWGYVSEYGADSYVVDGELVINVEVKAINQIKHLITAVD